MLRPFHTLYNYRCGKFVLECSFSTLFVSLLIQHLNQNGEAFLSTFSFVVRLLMFPPCSVSVSLYMLDKLVCKWAMLAGSFTVWNMASNQTVKCHLTRPLEVVMTPSTLSSVRQELANMFPELCLWIWNQLLSVSKHEV